MDIASLSLQIDTSDVSKAEADLDRLNQAGAQTEASAKKVGAAWKGAAQAIGADNGLKAAQNDLAALIGKIDPVVGALGRLDDMEQQLRAHRKTGLLGAEDFNQYAGKIDAMRKSLAGASGDLGKVGQSAGQTAQALRMLPAQFTDIAVGLSTGQSPFSVLLQQGGQLKDSFGGIGPAVQALGGYVAGLVNPFTIAAVAVGALALAYKQGSDEATAFSKSIILSGNAAGTTADDLAGMAEAIDSTVGTTSRAADALAEMVTTGKIAEGQLQSLATAAIAFEDATGQAVSKTVADFAKLADDPVKASARLNEQYNYLTASVFEQIQALEQQGRTAEAAALAQDTYADALEDRAEQIKASLGSLETAWNAVGSAASDAWDAVLAVGREETIDQRIADLKEQLQEVADAGSAGPRGRAAFQLGAGKGGGAGLAQELNTLELEREQQQGEARQKAFLAQANKEAIEAEQDIFALRQSNLTKLEKKEKEIAEYRANVEKIRTANPFSKLIDPAQVDKDLAAIEAKYAEKAKKTPTAKAFQDDAATRLLANLREQGAALDGQLSTTEKLTSSQAALLKFQQQIADLKTKDILTADQQSLLANQEAISAQLQKNVALADEIQKREALQKLQGRAAQIQESIASSIASTKEQQDNELGAFGKGKTELERIKEEAKIRKEFQRYQEQLNRAADDGTLDSKQYKDESAKIQAALNDRLAMQKDYYAKLEDLQADSSKGMQSAWADYLDTAKDVSSQTYDLFSGAFTGMEDALVEFAMTGKLSFKDLADQIIADLIRIEIKQAVLWAVGDTKASSSGKSGLGDLFSKGLEAWAALDSGGASAGGSATYKGAFGFDGGGYTGDAARLGGVDGKGGFMAILHPQETVIDHTKPSRGMGGGTVTIGSMNFPGITNAREARTASAEAARQIARAVGSAGRYA